MRFWGIWLIIVKRLRERLLFDTPLERSSLLALFGFFLLFLRLFEFSSLRDKSGEHLIFFVCLDLVVVMQLLKENWVNLQHILEDKLQLLVVVSHEVITSEASLLVDNEVVLLFVKNVVLVTVGFVNLVSVSYNEGHERER